MWGCICVSLGSHTGSDMYPLIKFFKDSSTSVRTLRISSSTLASCVGSVSVDSVPLGQLTTKTGASHQMVYSLQFLILV